MKRFLLVVVPLVLVAAATIGACGRRSTSGGQAQLLEIAQSRGLSPEDAARAVKTFVAPAGATNTCCSRRAGIPVRFTSSASRRCGC
jgi:hypothetical protein